MKTILQRPIKFGILFSAIMLMNAVAFGASFTAVASGNWSSTTTWGGTVPSLNNTGDQITIPASINVVMNSDLTLNGATSQVTVNGTLSSVTGNVFTITNGILAGSGSISADSMKLAAGASVLFTGSITAKKLSVATLSIQGGISIMVNEQLTLSGGTTSIGTGGTLTVAANANVIMAGGQLTQTAGTLGLTSSYNVVYQNGATNTGLELSGSGLNNVTVDVGGSNTLLLSGNLTLNGTLTLSSGTLSLSGHNLTVAGNVSASGTGSIHSTIISNITITSAINMSGALMFTTTSGVNNLTINTGSGHAAAISGQLTVNGTLTLTSGILKLQSAKLVITGNVAASGSGTISSTTGSSITINTSTALAGGLKFTSGSNTVDTLSVNVGGSGSLIISSDLTINDRLVFTAGRVNIGNHRLTIGASGTITGADSSSYVITDTAGSLGMTVSMLASSTFPVGTDSAYFPATAQMNLLSTSRVIRIGVSKNVYAKGTSGGDISTTQPVVDATWRVTSDVSSNLNLNLELMWPSSAEVNGFMRSQSYISHYSSGSWDTSTVSAALTSTVTGLFSLKRTNITSLSPYGVFDERAEPNGSAVGISVVNSSTGIIVYPNPASENISIKIEESAGAVINVDIISITGQITGSYQISGSDTVIPVNALPSGTYFIKLYNDKINTVKQFTKL